MYVKKTDENTTKQVRFEHSKSAFLCQRFEDFFFKGWINHVALSIKLLSSAAYC